ncbi:MAG: hypothetical protein AAF827_17460 [Cyanobacteria bacterium P01_D01_bin.6]
MTKLIKTLIAATLLTASWGAIAPLSLRADMGHDHGGESTPPTTETPHEGEHHDHGGHEGHAGHSHGRLMIPAGQPIPEITLDVFPDPVAGWNLQVQTANWTFAPEAVNTISNLTEGHGHLYINGEQVTRIYSEWYYIPSLPPGEHILTVGLNANGHEALIHGGEPIEASVKVIVSATSSTLDQ